MINYLAYLVDNLQEHILIKKGMLKVYNIRLKPNGEESQQFSAGVYIVAFGHTGGYIGASHIGLAIFTNHQNEDRWDNLIPITQSYNGGSYTIQFNPSKRKLKLKTDLLATIPVYITSIFGTYGY